MFKTTKTETETSSAPSRKREVTAVVAASVVALALSLGANHVIGRVSDQVKNKINPPKPETDA